MSGINKVKASIFIIFCIFLNYVWADGFQTAGDVQSNKPSGKLFAIDTTAANVTRTPSTTVYGLYVLGLFVNNTCAGSGTRTFNQTNNTYIPVPAQTISSTNTAIGQQFLYQAVWTAISNASGGSGGSTMTPATLAPSPGPNGSITIALVTSSLGGGTPQTDQCTGGCTGTSPTLTAASLLTSGGSACIPLGFCDNTAKTCTFATTPDTLVMQ